jgi:hypothetical protein
VLCSRAARAGALGDVYALPWLPIWPWLYLLELAMLDLLDLALLYLALAGGFQIAATGGRGGPTGDGHFRGTPLPEFLKKFDF